MGSRPAEDFTGRVYGSWKVLKTNGHTNKFCECECLRCGTVKDVFKGALKAGQTNCCRKCANKDRERNRTPGETHGNNIIVDGVKHFLKSGELRFLCRCAKCGSERLVANKIIEKGSQCRACYDAERAQRSPKTTLVGRKFGMVTVVREVSILNAKGNPVWRWECLCECGEIALISDYELLKGEDRFLTCGKRSHRRKKDKCRQWRGVGEISGSKWRSIQNCARRRGGRSIELTVTLQYIWDLFVAQNRRCAYSNRPLEFPERNGAKATASLDRIDSSKGYIPGNVQWVHKDVNTLKMDLSEADFIALCDEISVHCRKRHQGELSQIGAVVTESVSA